MKIRLALAADADGIARVHVLTWQEAYRGLVPQDYLDRLEIDRRRERWERILRATDWPRTGVFVAETEAGIIGFAHVIRSRDEDAGAAVGEVTSIYVLATAWGTGAGRALMAAAVGALHDAGFAEATLWVLERNARARRFYEIAGWTVDGAERADEVSGTRLSEVRYRRSLRGT